MAERERVARGRSRSPEGENRGLHGLRGLEGRPQWRPSGCENHPRHPWFKPSVI